MAEPIGVVVLSNGNILVSDGEKACIHMFDESGKYQGRFGNITYLKYPAGIIFDGFCSYVEPQHNLEPNLFIILFWRLFCMGFHSTQRL